MFYGDNQKNFGYDNNETTTELQPIDTISIIRCEIYHLLSFEICDICKKVKFFKSRVEQAL